MANKIPPTTASNPKLEDYELDNHVRTMQDAHNIMSDPKLMKAVHKHAKGKLSGLKKVTNMMKPGKDDNDGDEAGSSKPIKDLDGLRAAKKKMKSDMFGDE